jgi:hypothetical protein
MNFSVFGRTDFGKPESSGRKLSIAEPGLVPRQKKSTTPNTDIAVTTNG